jgi:hypothetical protein
VITHFLPHLNRDAVYRILKAEGLGRLPNRRYKPPDSDALPPALQVVAAAKEVSHPDTRIACNSTAG